jgi:hypothetical protein
MNLALTATRNTLDALVTAVLVVISFAPVSAQVPASKTGQVQDGSYQNSFFGLTYTPDSNLIFNTSEFSAGKP